MLDVTPDELRFLVRSYILQGDEEGASVARVQYRPADLLILKLLSERRVLSTTVH